MQPELPVTKGVRELSILIVEDEFLIALQAQDALIDAGFKIAGTAATADDAVRLAVANRPALAIMDIRLAGKRDGIDAALELFIDHRIRCVFATAHADRDVMRRAQPANPLGWLQKPYTMASLVAAVQSAFEQLRAGPG